VEISHEQRGDVLVVTLKGRLDATWSRHVAETVTALIREGAHRIHLDMAEVTYVSSAGIGTLLHLYKELQGLRGEFAVPRYSPSVQHVIDLAGLSSVLTGAALPKKTGESGGGESAEVVAPVAKLDRIVSEFEIYKIGAPPPLRGRLLGDPAKLRQGSYGEADCVREKFVAGSLGLGLGAFGSGFTDCRSRFGEFLAVHGSAAYLPSDESQAPDYVTQEGALVPEVNILYGLAAHGKFSRFATFQNKAADERVGMREVANACLEISEAPVAAAVMVVEASSLVGASLRQSPALPRGETPADPFAFPAVREWFSFTVERAYRGCIALMIGVVARDGATPLGPFLRPLGVGSGALGHFHAAAFSYRPLRKGKLDLGDTIKRLFEHHHLNGILHLLSDDRELTGVGESEFIRGACWIGGLELASA
jgi:anti-anti-sigma factor